jgi:coproporphyrinogen III oxidase
MLSDNQHPDIFLVESYFKKLQQDICTGLEEKEKGAKFKSDNWERIEGGGGDTRVMEGGSIIEKGGVNFSHVHGPLPEKIANRLQLPIGLSFHATGTSLVIHPLHPLIPVIHMNVRYFQIENGVWWFGGGIDLTPAYVFPEDAVFFHKQLQAVCRLFGEGIYPEFKKNCDEYFYLKHRDETRGIGGLFFDFLKPGGIFSDAKTIFHFVQAVGNTFLPIYLDLISRNEQKIYTPEQKAFQLWRRGRYVEFNLLYDKGTSFGLDTGGRTESILMSLPPLTSWRYDFNPEQGSVEADTLQYLKPIDWLNFRLG